MNFAARTLLGHSAHAYTLIARSSESNLWRANRWIRMSVRTQAEHQANYCHSYAATTAMHLRINVIERRSLKMHTKNVSRTQAIFGGGNGGRSDVCCNRSDSTTTDSISSTDGVNNATRAGMMEVGKQNASGP